MLADAGHAPREVRTRASLTLARTESGFKLSKIRLETTGAVDGIDDATFQQLAQKAKDGCPVSQLLKPGLEELSLKAVLQK
jgi:osmotically inducible protein OsmC